MTDWFDVGCGVILCLLAVITVNMVSNHINEVYKRRWEKEHADE